MGFRAGISRIGHALRAAPVAMVLGVIAPGAMAQTTSETMRFIIGAAAGGAIDNYVRVIAEPMAQRLGKIAIIENKPGANGNISAQFVLENPPDGNMIWVGTQSMLEINPSVYTDLKWSLRDFTPIIKGVEAPLVFVTHPDVPAKSLAEFVSWVKDRPGKLGYASFSPGSSSHFLGHQLNDQFGLDLTHVAYRGTGPQTTDLLAGHVQLGFTQLQSALPHIQAGKLNALAITSAMRSKFLGDVPTFSELGYPTFTTTIWYGLFVRSDAGDIRVNGLIDAARTSHAAPAVAARLESGGFNVAGTSGSAFREEIQVQVDKWAKLVKATNFKPQ